MVENSKREKDKNPLRTLYYHRILEGQLVYLKKTNLAKQTFNILQFNLLIREVEEQIQTDFNPINKCDGHLIRKRPY